MKDLNHYFRDCKIEFGKIGIALCFIKPRLFGENVDPGIQVEFNRLSTAYNSAMGKLDRIEKIVIQTFGNVSSKDLVIEKKKDSKTHVYRCSVCFGKMKTKGCTLVDKKCPFCHIGVFEEIL